MQFVIDIKTKKAQILNNEHQLVQKQHFFHKRFASYEKVRIFAPLKVRFEEKIYLLTNKI